jgi:ribonuclease R
VANKKKFKQNDPFYKRETKKYSFPVPSREYVLEILDKFGCPVKAQRLLEELEIEEGEERKAMTHRLRAMVRDGQLLLDRRGRYCLAKKLELIPGRVQGHPDGYGFLIPDDGDTDLFLSPKEMRSVLDGDRVLVRKVESSRRGQTEAVVHEILERGNLLIAGMLSVDKNIAYVEPENKRISRSVTIPLDALNGAKDGQVVVVELDPTQNRHQQLCGKVIEILGEVLGPGMEIDIAIRSHGLPHHFSNGVIREIDTLPDTVTQEEINGRKDLRDKNFVTIDGADAMDFDDAVYCQPRSNGGWQLMVAIADVSHYVKPGSALDIEAQSRGNSVYFPGRVVPMLPEQLSNHLCSLKPEVDRLTLVCDMTVSKTGSLEKYRFCEAVIHSSARLTYDEVSAMLEHDDKALKSKYEKIIADLAHLYDLYKVLHEARHHRGALEIDSVETRIVFNEDKKIEDIVPVVRNDAHRLIEECMLLANVATAQYLEKHTIPTLYRVHAPPKQEKIDEFREFLGRLGLSLGGGQKPDALEFTRILDATRGRPDNHLIQAVLLRSLCQAMYSPDNIGHFGLAYQAYAHFTSPIRRYPDLLVHRGIKHTSKIKGYANYPYDEKIMQQIGLGCSTTERRADDATRDVVLWLKCEYMQEHLGSIFNGVISGVTHFGIFVELEGYYVEGLVHVTSLPSDYYQFEPHLQALIGERSGRRYALADRLKVQVVRVDLDDRKIDFELASD